MICDKCGYKLKLNDKYCPNCGRVLFKNDSLWLLVLGFIFPMPSIIAYICLKLSKSPIGSNLIKGAIANLVIQFIIFIFFIIFVFFSGAFDAVNNDDDIDYNNTCNIYCEGKDYKIKDNRCVCEDGKIFDFEYK